MLDFITSKKLDATNINLVRFKSVLDDALNVNFSLPNISLILNYYTLIVSQLVASNKKEEAQYQSAQLIDIPETLSLIISKGYKDDSIMKLVDMEIDLGMTKNVVRDQDISQFLVNRIAQKGGIEKVFEILFKKGK